ncbi:MAG TPA: twin-arginine translocase TatA/TatE family subunit [Thermodesulfovibrionales bacterium]|nr:twin-arginine translocase TatA/TatE family subunit [Thermodesulfovibrionales bacterium]
MGGLFQPMHLLVILVIALVIFGPGKLPELGSSIGKGIKEFKKAMTGDEKDAVTEIKKEVTQQDSRDGKA